MNLKKGWKKYFFIFETTKEGNTTKATAAKKNNYKNPFTPTAQEAQEVENKRKLYRVPFYL